MPNTNTVLKNKKMYYYFYIFAHFSFSLHIAICDFWRVPYHPHSFCLLGRYPPPTFPYCLIVFFTTSPYSPLLYEYTLSLSYYSWNTFLVASLSPANFEYIFYYLSDTFSLLAAPFFRLLLQKIVHSTIFSSLFFSYSFKILLLYTVLIFLQHYSSKSREH